MSNADSPHVSPKRTRKKKHLPDTSEFAETVVKRSVTFEEQAPAASPHPNNEFGEDAIDTKNRGILSEMEKQLLEEASKTPHRGEIVLDMVTWKEPDRIEAILKTMKSSDPYMDICGTNDHPPGSTAHSQTAVRFMESALGFYDRNSGLPYSKYFRKRLELFMRAKYHRTYLVREFFTRDMPEYNMKSKPRTLAYAIVSVFKGLKQSTVYDMQHHMYMNQGASNHVTLRLHSLSGRLLQRGSEAAAKLVKYAVCHTYASHRSLRKMNCKSNPLFTFVTSLYRIGTPGKDFIFQLPPSTCSLVSQTSFAAAEPVLPTTSASPPSTLLPSASSSKPVSKRVTSTLIQHHQKHLSMERDARVCTKLTQFYNNKLGMFVAATLYVHLLQVPAHVHDNFFHEKLNTPEKPEDIRYILLRNASPPSSPTSTIADTNAYTMDIETANLQYISDHIDDYRWRLKIVPTKYIRKHIDEFAPFGDELLMVSPMRTMESFLDA